MISTTAQRAEKAWKLLKDLVKVDTSNPPGNEAPCADIIRKFFSNEGLSYASIEKDRGRPNVISRIKGKGPALMLASHLDVVPVIEERWTHPPFGAHEEGGYLYGRGTLDMKHFAAMTAVITVAARHKQLKRDLVYCAVPDEETTCEAGSKFLVAKHHKLIEAEYMLGEGGGFTQYAGSKRFYPIGCAEKGQLTVRVFFKGMPGHGSLPHPDNAVFKASKALLKLRNSRFPFHVTRTAREFFHSLGRQVPGLTGIGLRCLAAPALAPFVFRLMSPERASEMRALLSHTASPNMFKGSESSNVIPGTVAVDLDVRILPGFGPPEALRELWKVLGRKYEHEIIEYLPGLTSPINTPLYKQLEAAVFRHDHKAAAAPFLEPYFTDAGYYRRLGTKCYGFAPLVFRKRDAQEVRFRIHGHDERVRKEAFLKGYALLEDAVFTFLET